MNEVQLSAGPLQLVLLPSLGGSIGRFEWIDGNHVFPILRSEAAPASPLQAGCFPLVPYCNRIRGGAFHFRGRDVVLAPNMAGDPSPLHGQGWLSHWQVEEQAAATAQLLFVHGGGEWPWPYAARQRLSLDACGLTVDLGCTNTGDAAMPCGLGFHPYFPCDARTRLTTRVENVWTVDEQVLPVERVAARGRYDLTGGPICGRELDNGYDGWSGAAAIETPDARFRITLSSPGTRFFQLYSPRQGGLFVAEPVTHANAALNAPEDDWPTLGLKLLAPGETMALRMRLDIDPT